MTEGCELWKSLNFWRRRATATTSGAFSRPIDSNCNRWQFVERSISRLEDFLALGCVCKHANQSPSGCCGGRHLERGAQEAAKASARPKSKIHSNFPETTKKATHPTVKGVRDIDATIRKRILENHSSCAPETEQRSIKDVFKNHGS